MTNRYAKEIFEAHRDLGDGTTLTLRMACYINRRIYETEDVDDPEPSFFIEGKPVLRSELPGEITTQVIDELINAAEPISAERSRKLLNDY